MSAKAKDFHNLIKFQSSSTAKGPDYTLGHYSVSAHLTTQNKTTCYIHTAVYMYTDGSPIFTRCNPGKSIDSLIAATELIHRCRGHSCLAIMPVGADWRIHLDSCGSLLPRLGKGMNYITQRDSWVNCACLLQKREEGLDRCLLSGLFDMRASCCSLCACCTCMYRVACIVNV